MLLRSCAIVVVQVGSMHAQGLEGCKDPRILVLIRTSLKQDNRLVRMLLLESMSEDASREAATDDDPVGGVWGRLVYQF